jgi:hypothetical protein
MNLAYTSAMVNGKSPCWPLLAATVAASITPTPQSPTSVQFTVSTVTVKPTVRYLPPVKEASCHFGSAHR